MIDSFYADLFDYGYDKAAALRAGDYQDYKYYENKIDYDTWKSGVMEEKLKKENEKI